MITPPRSGTLEAASLQLLADSLQGVTNGGRPVTWRKGLNPGEKP